MDEERRPAADTRWITERARKLGFDECGIAPAEKFPELEHYAEWLERGYAGEMKYLADERRQDVRSASSGVRSVIVCALNYNCDKSYSTEIPPETRSGEMPRGWISRYAWGDDYHEVLWEKLNLLAGEMRAHFTGEFELRAYADTGPVHERSAAKRAGLGWMAKNTLLINQHLGSWLFLGIIVTSLPLAPTLGTLEAPPADRCGTCRRCIDACPTSAIVEPYVLDARRCISYLTIELRSSIPEQLRQGMGRHVFGCDICQDVCPWNRKAPHSELKEFQPREFRLSGGAQDTDSLFLPELLRIAELSLEEFREVFRGSPVKRTKWEGLVRNACIALGNAKIDRESENYGKVCAALRRLSESENQVVAESAGWALQRIQEAVV
jgi:epoxyqueuosine reductase